MFSNVVQSYVHQVQLQINHLLYEFLVYIEKKFYRELQHSILNIRYLAMCPGYLHFLCGSSVQCFLLQRCEFLTLCSHWRDRKQWQLLCIPGLFEHGMMHFPSQPETQPQIRHLWMPLVQLSNPLNVNRVAAILCS